MTNFTDPVERLVVESVENLKKYKPNFTTADLEAEAIYLASFIYLQGDYRIDFQVDYLAQDLLNSIESGNYKVADKVFSFMKKHYPEKYGHAEFSHGIEGYKMNIQLAPDYGSYIKNHFIHVHKIGKGGDYSHFSSPRNCLWLDSKLIGESSTQRDIYYKISDLTFELMIPPYNPLVTGKVLSKTNEIIKCQSSDNTRTFIFHYNGNTIHDNLDYIEMFRNDKGDMVTYLKS